MREHNNLFYRFLTIFGALVLVILNETIGYNNLGIYMAYIEAFLVMFFILFKHFTLAFLMHTLFVLTSLEWSADLYSLQNIFTYRTVDIFGISLSSVILIILFVINYIFYGFKTQINNIFLKFMLIVFMGFLIGGSGLIFSDYKINFFISDFFYWVIVLISALLFTKILRRNPYYIKDIEWILISVLVARSFVKFFGIFWGLQKGKYGGISIFSFDTIDIFIPFLIFSFLQEKNMILKFLIIISWVLGSISVVFTESSGKAILLFFLVFLVIFIKLFRGKKYIIIKTIFIMFFVLFYLVFYPMFFNLIENNNLFLSKFNQVCSLLSFSWIKDPYILPLSPQTRILEMYNILAYYFENPIYCITGRGFGGYFEDIAFYNYFASDMGGYSIEEIVSRKFVKPHESFNFLLLKFGICGILFYIYLLYRIWKLRKYCGMSISLFLKLVGFLIVLFFIGYSLKIAFILGFFISII
jgi:hypothetical protein